VNSSRLHHRTESLSKVHTRPLSETVKDPMHLVPLEGIIRLEFVLEDPLAGEHVGLSGAWHEILGVVYQNSTMFLFHSCSQLGSARALQKVFDT
jgi:hypothetical protein